MNYGLLIRWLFLIFVIAPIWAGLFQHTSNKDAMKLWTSWWIIIGGAHVVVIVGMCISSYGAVGHLPIIPKQKMEWISADRLAPTYFSIPLKKFYKETGKVPMWMPYIFGGMPSWGSLMYNIYPRGYNVFISIVKWTFWLYVLPMAVRNEHR